jgi:hypothetical protein
MCGIVALYAAIVQTTALPHSYGISNGWTWLSRILNTPPRRITPLLLHTFLEVAGYDLYKQYPNQMPKVMRVLIQDVLPRMPEAAVASVTRLQLFLEETVIKSGTIPMPSGKHLKKS